MVRRDDDSDDSLKDRLDEAIRAHEAKTQALVDRIVALEATAKEHGKAVTLGNKIVYGALALALASAGYGADKIWSGAEHYARSEMRMDYFEKNLERVLERPSSSPRPASSWLTPPVPPSTKDQP